MQIVCHVSVQIVQSHILHHIINVSLHNLILGQRMLLLELCCSCLNRVKLRVWVLFLWKEWERTFFILAVNILSNLIQVAKLLAIILIVRPSVLALLVWLINLNNLLVSINQNLLLHDRTIL